MLKASTKLASPADLNEYEPVPQSEPTTDGAPSASPAQRAPWQRLYMLSIANFGIGVLWALQVALATPYFAESLRTSAVLSHSIWMVSPISGVLIAPAIATLSDRCTSRWGRRRPFIFVASVLTVCSMLIFCHSLQLGAALSARRHDASAARSISVLIAVGSFSVMDLSMGTAYWCIQALHGDLVPASQQHELQSATFVMMSVGDIAASALVNYFDTPVSMIAFCISAAAFLYASSVAVLLVVGKETPRSVDDVYVSHADDASMSIVNYVRALPSWMFRIGFTHSLGFFMLFCVVPYTSTWFGSSVLRGDPSADVGSKERLAYERGVRLSGKAAVIRAFAQIVFSAVYPVLLKWMTPGQLMGCSYAISSLCIAVLSATSNESLAVFLIVIVALPRVTQNTIPAGCTLQYSDESNRGRLVGALSIFAAFPQLIDTLYTGYVSKAFGESVVLRLGAAWGIVTALFGFFVMKGD